MNGIYQSSNNSNSNTVIPSHIDESRIVSPSELYEPLKCLVCLSLCTSPVLLSCCNCLTCSQCVSDWLKKSGTCPKCRSTSVKTEAPNAFILRLFGNLRIKCIFENEGCKEVTSYDYINDHESVCVFNKETKIKCEKCELDLKFNLKDQHDCVIELLKVNKELSLQLEFQNKLIIKNPENGLSGKSNFSTNIVYLPVPNDKKDIILQLLSTMNVHSHPLYQTKRNHFICDICISRNYLSNSYYCSQCDFDLCIPCFNIMKGKKLTNHNHPHDLSIQPSSRGFICDICRKSYKMQTKSYRCNPCDYDVCFQCRFTN